MPVAAVMCAGSLNRIAGSSTATSGMNWLSAMRNFLFSSGKVMMAATVVSEPVPAVVGTAMNGGSAFSAPGGERPWKSAHGLGLLLIQRAITRQARKWVTRSRMWQS